MAENKTAPEKKPAKKQKDAKPSLFAKIGAFFKEAKSELAKVVWPSPKQTLDSTVTVLVIALIAAVTIGVIDWVFKMGVQLILGI